MVVRLTDQKYLFKLFTPPSVRLPSLTPHDLHLNDIAYSQESSENIHTRIRVKYTISDYQ